MTHNLKLFMPYRLLRHPNVDATPIAVESQESLWEGLAVNLGRARISRDRVDIGETRAHSAPTPALPRPRGREKTDPLSGRLRVGPPSRTVEGNLSTDRLASEVSSVRGQPDHAERRSRDVKTRP